MGLAKNQIHEKMSNNKKRGSVNNERRLDTFRKAVGSTGADWGGCKAEKMQGVVVAITELGGAVTFGLSRDNGAHSVTIMLDGERETLWFNGDADLDSELDSIEATLEAMK